jgi:hypothetical protein
MAKMDQVKSKKLPAKQGDFLVGAKRPPKEHQFKPGQSGNPKGPPKRRTQLWVYFCEYMNMTDAELNIEKRKKNLSVAQKGAIQLAEDFAAGKDTASVRLAKYAIDRDEGRAAETINLNAGPQMSDEKAEEIRQTLRMIQENC